MKTLHPHPRRGPRRGGPGFNAGPGFGPAFGAMGGFGPPGGRGGRRGRGRSRGDVRLAVLALLEHEPMHGYQIIQEITERSGGSWTPSPGSVYPTISQLADEGLVRTEKADGRSVVHLTETGSRYTTEHADELASVWTSIEGQGHEGVRDMRGAVHSLVGAAMQVTQAGGPDQVSEAVAILQDARRRMYLLLAGEEQTGDPDPTA